MAAMKGEAPKGASADAIVEITVAHGRSVKHNAKTYKSGETLKITEEEAVFLRASGAVADPAAPEVKRVTPQDPNLSLRRDRSR